MSTPTTKPVGSRQRERRVVENREFDAFTRRIVRAYARRVAAGDVEALAALKHLSATVETATADAVQGLRIFGYSWSEIAARLGVSRQAAQMRWGAHRRTVPLPQVVADAIEAHWKEYPPGKDGTIFMTRFAGPYRHDYYGSRIFRQAVATAKLPEGTTTHDLRHHYASVLLMQGESVIVVAERLGHENAVLVLSTYGHLMPDSEDHTRRAIDDALSGAPDVPQPDEPEE